MQRNEGNILTVLKRREQIALIMASSLDCWKVGRSRSDPKPTGLIVTAAVAEFERRLK